MSVVIGLLCLCVYVHMHACMCYLMATTLQLFFTVYNAENTLACLGMTVLTAAVMMQNYGQQLLPV